jgi:hypothetical protein
MTSREIITSEKRENSTLSTADLAGFDSKPPAPVDRTEAERNVPLFASNDAQDFRSRWERIQIGFVDEPRQAVERADELVASAIKRLAEVFATERHKLEGAWEKNDDVSTEELRVALRRYRSFFDRLLAV